MGRVVHFEIAADDPERAASFYTKVFGWSIQKWGGPEEYWLAMTGPDKEQGINGAIMRRTSPGVTTVNSIEVASVDQFIAKITKAGGKILTPKTPIPGVGYFAYCQDTESNTFGIMQADKSVK